MADMMDLISKLSDTHLENHPLLDAGGGSPDVARKVFYFEFADACPHCPAADCGLSDSMDSSGTGLSPLSSGSPSCSDGASFFGGSMSGGLLAGRPAANFQLSQPMDSLYAGSRHDHHQPMHAYHADHQKHRHDQHDDDQPHRQHAQHRQHGHAPHLHQHSHEPPHDRQLTKSHAGGADHPDQAQLRLQILLDLYVVGNSRSSEQGALQLLRMCDRLFAGFLQRMGRLLQLLGWMPCAQLVPLRPLEQALDGLQAQCGRAADDARLPQSLAALDAQQLFSYMFSLLLCILLPVEEAHWTQFLRVSCAKFNNCLRLAWSETQFRALLRLLRPPFARLQHYRHLLCARSALFEQELLNCIEHNAFANGLLKEMCYHFLSIKQQPGSLS